MRNKVKKNIGMSLIELLVVLTIFSVMSAVVVFNYDVFQAKVDLNNLASDIALKFVDAQQSSLAGEFPPIAQQLLISDPDTWKPSYGVHVNIASDKKSFTYFTDIDQNGFLSNPACGAGGECLEKITITKGNIISNIEVFYVDNPTHVNFNDITITFARPNAGAVIKSTTEFTDTVEYIRITILSPKLSTATIDVFAFGRIEVN